VFRKISGIIVNVALHDNSSNENLKFSLVLINVYSLYSYRKRHIEHLLTLTDSFTWEELPIRDPDTGYLTKAGYIPVIQRLTKYACLFAYSYFLMQAAFRIVTEHELMLTSGLPFDLSVTTLYVIANTIQVSSTV
jgi:hypothetical protein